MKLETSEEEKISAVQQTSTPMDEFTITSSLRDLQSDEQRRVLDTIARVRKCGLESILSLPQLVVCGDQSAGKSSVLEALTEIPFPRNDNLCTRYATEIILRHGPVSLLTVKVIPDSTRPATEQEQIKGFAETITDFDDLPRLMALATELMGISNSGKKDSSRGAFAKDILSIDIEGPSRPQLTLVDIPGLIQTSTKGVSDVDVELVAEITQRYISQPRTICLAVVSATNDAANQPILRKVRLVDPDGARTLGIITKPDRLPAGSGSEAKFIELARNEDVYFRLGWHVLKNRNFEQGDCSLEERNLAESIYFSTSNFKSLPAENLGIDTLRIRLSRLLFEHVKLELPKLRRDLEGALDAARKNFAALGNSRADALECKAYLSQLSMEYWELCTAAVNGHYEHSYFQSQTNEPFDVQSKSTIVRLRAVIQHMNTEFCDKLHTNGQKFQIELDDETPVRAKAAKPLRPGVPIRLSKADAIKWVHRVMVRTRGKELVGNFNPLLIGALFWEQASNWKNVAVSHVELVSRICNRCLEIILDDKTPKDVKARLWATKIADTLKTRRQAAFHELDLIMQDLESFPINYNHYYTDTVQQLRMKRQKHELENAIRCGIETKMTTATGMNANHPGIPSERVNITRVLESFYQSSNSNMESFSCEEALDCLFAIYKVQEKIFIANITTQVIERHIVRGIERIFSPVVVSLMTDSEVEAIASEPPAMKRQRAFLTDRINMLEEGYEIFRDVLAGAKK